jgi:hypothetical protein
MIKADDCVETLSHPFVMLSISLVRDIMMTIFLLVLSVFRSTMIGVLSLATNDGRSFLSFLSILDQYNVLQALERGMALMQYILGPL